MKSGRTLQDLCQEIERQQAAKVDYIADTREMKMQPIVEAIEHADVDRGEKVHPMYAVSPGKIELVVPDETSLVPLSPTAHTHSQIASRLKIDKRYYNRMLDEAPALLAHNVNYWFQETPENRMVRSLDGIARAFVSDGFKVVDHFDLLHMVLPVLSERGNLDIRSCEVTENRLYLKVFFKDLERAVPGCFHTDPETGGKVGSIVQAGFQVRNCEIGKGNWEVIPMLMELWCTNGATVNKLAKKGRHFGRRQEAGVFRYREDTRRSELQTIQLQVRDTILACADERQFGKLIDQYAAAKNDTIEGDPIEAVKVLRAKSELLEDEENGIVRYLIEGGSLDRWGLSQAVTRFSQDVESYDRASELESIGYNVIDMPKGSWQEIAEAA